jgi:hypothetical protein
MGLDWNSSSSPLMCGISMICIIAQGPLPYGSLRDYTFLAPIFHLLYLLPPHISQNSSSSFGIPSLDLCILSPSLPSSSLPSFSLVLRLSSFHPPVPLCAQIPLAIGLHGHHTLLTQKHLYPRTQLFHEPLSQTFE